jgi:hypothetical protein
MVDKRFPEGAFKEDGQPNIPSQAYADYLTDYYDANPMVPRADPVGYVAPAPKTPRDEPLSNFGFNVAGDYAKDAGQSFKNAVTGQGVATVLPEMRFYPGGPTGAEYVYGGIADAGLGAINALFAGLGAGAGFVAEQIPFQSESQEDRLSRDLLAGVEFAEQYLAPYLGLFSRLGRASKAVTSANRAPEAPVAVAVATEPQITISPTLSGGTSLADAITAAQAAERANRLQVDDILFSPSLKAAMDLKQKKGPYEQLKATMIKTGAKPDELEWSGADDFFSGKNVTKEEIIDYLEQNDPRLVPNVRRAEGVLGSEAEAMDMREAVDQVLEDGPWLSEATNNYRDLLADNLPDAGYRRPDEIDDGYLEEQANKLGTNLDDLRGKDWVYIDKDGDAEFFQYSEDALAHQYGGENRLQEEINIRVRENLEYEYENDPPNFMYRYGVENPNPMDEGDTQYAQYFPEGGTDYTESLFQYTDPTGRIKIDTLAGSRHFGEDDAGTIFHTRHADYVNEDGDTVRYVGEIQSDPQQRLTNMNYATARDYERSLQEEEMTQLRTDMKLVEIRAVEDQKLAFESELDEFQLARLGYETSIYNLNKDLKNPNSYTSQLFDTLASKIEGEIPSSGELTDAQEELVNAYIQQSGNQFRGGRRWARLKDAQDEVYEYLVGSEVSWLPEDTKKRIFDIAEDAVNKQQELKKDLIELETKAYDGDVAKGSKILKPGGPFMSSQNKWLDEGLRRSIYDAVKDPDVDYLAFPNDPEAIAKVGGHTAGTVKEGTVNYYQRDVQNRLKKLLKAFSKDVNVDEINIQSEDFGAFSSKGFKITPEFRKAVMEKGIPTYVVPLAVGTGMGYGALDQVGGQNGESGS